MKKQKKLKSVGWFQMPTNLFADERMVRLIRAEGAAGLGIYLYILSEIYRRHSHQMTRGDVRDLARRGFTKLRLKRVLNDYGLFAIDDYSHVTSTIDCCNISELINPTPITDEEETMEAIEDEPIEAIEDETTEADEEPTEENEDELMEADDEETMEENEDEPMDEELTEADETDSEKKTRRNREENVQPTPARIKKTQTQTQSSSSYRRRNCAGAGKAFRLDCSARPVATVDEIIAQMRAPTPWSEAVIMNSGFSKLLHDNWDKALGWFRLHIIERSKEGEILTLDHARRYFADLIHHPTTAALIQNYLQQLASHDRPYPYEDPTSRPGHRSYLGGCPLPDDAPSRPSPHHEWVLGRWEQY